MTEEGGYIQCVCGRVIRSAADYKLVFLRKEAKEIDIICPNDTCYLRELGYIKFDVVNGKPKIVKATFYSPFVTWNSARLGREKATELLKSHLKEIVQKHIDWKRIVKEFLESQPEGAKA